MWSRVGEWERGEGEGMGGGFCVEFDGVAIFVSVACAGVCDCVGGVAEDGSMGFEGCRGFGDETEVSAISLQELR